MLFRGNPKQSGGISLKLLTVERRKKMMKDGVSSLYSETEIRSDPFLHGFYEDKLSEAIMLSARMILDAAGIKDNQLALALDKVASHYTGYSLLALSGVTLVAPTKCQLLTPTEIGKHFGVSGRKVNKILCEEGYQKKNGNSYEPLEPGEPFAVMQDTGKQHSDGTPVRQLKWESSFITELEDVFSENYFDWRQASHG